MPGSLVLQGAQLGVAEGSRDLTFLIPMGSVNETLPVMLSSGSNTIPVPAGAEGVIIKPADSNTVALSLFGVLPINPAVACLVPFDPGAIPASLTIVAAGALPKPVMLFFF